MTQNTIATVEARDAWVEHPLGKLFARVWTPTDMPTSSERVPIVLFHDSLGCVDLWRDFPGALSAATGREVIAYDRLGFGRSDARGDMPAVDFVADEARRWFPAVRERFALSRYIAFGHSVGGGMAVNCAAAEPDACVALITESAQAFPEERTLHSIALAKEQFRDDSQRQRLVKYHGDKAEWVLHAWTDSWLDPAFHSWSLASVLPKVRCPVLAIHGEYDEYGSSIHPEMITGLCGGVSQMALLPDTHHVPHRERDGEVLNLVSGFLASLP